MIESALALVTTVLWGLAYFALWRSKAHEKAAAYYKGRTDELDLVLSELAEPETLTGDHRLRATRSQIAEYLGEKEARRWVESVTVTVEGRRALDPPE